MNGKNEWMVLGAPTQHQHESCERSEGGKGATKRGIEREREPERKHHKVDRSRLHC